MSGIAPRLAAFELLHTVLAERRTLDEAMAKSPLFRELTGSDRGLARAIVSAVFREFGRIDAALDPLLSRPLDSADLEVQALLRIGAAQSWVLGMPDHAVVSATVAAAKQLPTARRASGFINAVLRKVVADKAGFEAQPQEQIWPSWLRERFSKSLGPHKSLQLALAQSIQPETYLTPRNGNAAALAERLEAKVIADHSVQIPSGPVDTLPGYTEGDWWVQDVAASLPARLLQATPEDRILDLCAAPGGKTLQLAAIGAAVTAIDRSRNRLKRLHENLDRVGLSDRVDVIAAKIEQMENIPKADKILLDAPCSALGTLRRHPEGAWIKQAEDIARFPAIQARLLDAALTHLKPGGVLVYCVCTPLPAEGSDVVAALLAKNPDIQRRTIAPTEIAGFDDALIGSGDVLTLPNGRFGHDAFYIARLQRRTET